MAALLAVHAGSSGQERLFPRTGAVELSGTIAYANYSLVYQGHTGESTSLISFSPQAGYFFTGNIEIGISSGVILLPGLSVQSGGGRSTTAFQLFLTPAYHLLLGSETIIPFAEAQLGYTSLGATGFDSRSGFSYGGRGGIKVVPVDHMVLTFAAQYLAINLGRSGESERTGYNYFTIGVGVGAYF